MPETAVVTGAGRGIGLEIARRLAARGYANNAGVLRTQKVWERRKAAGG